MNIQITLKDTFDFVLSWEDAIGGKCFVHPYNSKRGALVFSFDGGLKPFLNYTKGYHRERAKRPYLATTPGVMAELCKLLRPYRDQGGRVFVDRKKAYFVDETGIKHHLCDLKWPDGIDIVTIVKNLRPRPPSMTLRVTHFSRKK